MANQLKQIRKTIYSIAKDYLEQSELGHNVPIWSLLENSKVLLTPQDMATVCKELNTTVDKVYTEPSDYQYEGAEQGKAAQDKDCEVKELAPEIKRLRQFPSNRRLSFRVKPDIEKQINEDLAVLGFENWGQYCNKYAVRNLHDFAENKRKYGE